MNKTIKNLYYFFKNKITIGLILTALASIIFAIILRYIIEYSLGVVPIRGGLGIVDLSYLSSIVFFRLLVKLILENYMGDNYTLPLLQYSKPTLDSKVYNPNPKGREGGVCPPAKTTLNMDDNKTISSTTYTEDEADKTHSHTISSSSKNSNPNSNNNSNPNSNKSKMLNTDEMLKLKDDMNTALDQSWNMIRKMRDLKLSNKIKYVLDKKGGLYIDANNDISDEELIKLSRKVGIMDRIINTKFEEYDKLQGKDLMSNNNLLSPALADLHKFCKDHYKNLFEKD